MSTAVPDVVAVETAQLIDIWDRRTREHGARCVMNLHHPEERYVEITQQQKLILFPLLARTLGRSVRRVLDYGCGPGRFTPGLAQLLDVRHGDGGEVVGFDVCSELLALAPAAPQVSYTSKAEDLDVGRVGRFDVAWVCLVLGGMSDEACFDAARRLTRCLAPGGQIFLVEHLAGQRVDGFWRIRTFAEYRGLFPQFHLRQIGIYSDFGSPVWVMTGARRPEAVDGLGAWLRYAAFELRQRRARLRFAMAPRGQAAPAIG